LNGLAEKKATLVAPKFKVIEHWIKLYTWNWPLDITFLLTCIFISRNPKRSNSKFTLTSPAT
jgi:hypothetical protein